MAQKVYLDENGNPSLSASMPPTYLDDQGNPIAPKKSLPSTSPAGTLAYKQETARQIANANQPSLLGGYVDEMKRNAGKLKDAILNTAPGAPGGVSTITPVDQVLMGGASLGPAAKAAGAAPAVTGLAERLYASALKAAPRTNKAAKVEQMIQTGIDEGIPVAHSGLQKLLDLKEGLKQQIESTIATNPEAPISPKAVASRADPLINRIAYGDQPADLASAMENKKAFMGRHSADVKFSPYGPTQVSTLPPEANIYAKSTNPPVQSYQLENPIPAARAQVMKQDIGKELGNAAYGSLQSGYVESQKQIQRGLKEELENLFPGIKGLNQREGGLINMEKDLSAAVNRGKNRDILGLGTPLLGGAVGAMTGSAPAAALSGAGREFLGSPQIKSRIAIALANAVR